MHTHIHIHTRQRSQLLHMSKKKQGVLTRGKLLNNIHVTLCMICITMELPRQHKYTYTYYNADIPQYSLSPSLGMR